LCRIAPFCRRPLPLGAAAVQLMHRLYLEHALPGAALRALFSAEFPLLLQARAPFVLNGTRRYSRYSMKYYAVLNGTCWYSRYSMKYYAA
jgi:hypothetical protein